MQAGVATISVQRKTFLPVVAAPARLRSFLLHVRNHATPCNGKAMVIVMIKIMFVDAVGMAEIAVDRKEIFSFALIVYAEIQHMIRNQRNNRSC